MFKKLFVLFCVLELSFGEKCSVIVDNGLKKVQCINVVSMMDIVDEIKSNWTYIEIVNQASHAKFSNNAGKSLK